MIVVADTTPLNYLILLGHIELLPRLYGSVLVPRAVALELTHPGAPAMVSDWFRSLPSWCEVRDLQSSPDKTLLYLDAGERDAIQLALELQVKTILMDDQEGRRAAELRNLRVNGTLAILIDAHQRKLLEIRSALLALSNTNFRISPALIDRILAEIA